MEPNNGKPASPQDTNGKAQEPQASLPNGTPKDNGQGEGYNDTHSAPSSLLGVGGLLEPGPRQTRDAILVRRAIRGGWVSDKLARQLLRRCRDALAVAESPRDIAHIGRVISSMASHDVARERNDTSERTAELAAGASAMRALLADPRIRAVLLESIPDPDKST